MTNSQSSTKQLLIRQSCQRSSCVKMAVGMVALGMFVGLMGCAGTHTPHSSPNHYPQPQHHPKHAPNSHQQHDNAHRHHAKSDARHDVANEMNGDMTSRVGHVHSHSHSHHVHSHSSHSHSHSHSHQHDGMTNGMGGVANKHAFAQWLNAHGKHSQRVHDVATYHNYLKQHLGGYDVPPMWQLLTTARDWQGCHQEQFEVPPPELWANILPTLRLYAKLKHQGILPNSSEIRSTYRNPTLNACAGGALNSSHKHHQAIDIWIPEYEYDAERLQVIKTALCQYWRYQGQADNFGLGLYQTGAIHIDTAKYRTWGGHHTAGLAFCLANH